MKSCSYCAEPIQDDAIRCRFCFKDLPAGNVNPKAVRDLKNGAFWIVVWLIGAFFAWNIGGGFAEAMDWPASWGHWGGVGLWGMALQKLDELTQQKG